MDGMETESRERKRSTPALATRFSNPADDDAAATVVLTESEDFSNTFYSTTRIKIIHKNQLTNKTNIITRKSIWQ